MQIPDYYQRLGISESATADEIKRVFRRLAKEYHPDRNPGDKAAEQRFKELSEAYDVLSDSDKRREYDQIRRSGSFEEALRHRQGRETGGTHEFHMDDSMSFEELFGSLFGENPFGTGRRNSGTRSRQSSRLQRGQDAEASIAVPLLTAIRGGKQRLRLADGRNIDLTIPAGTRSGTRLRLTGQGEQLAGSVAGDLYVQISHLPDQQYRLEGDAITKRITLSLREALLGTERIESFVSKDIRIQIPALSAPGTRLRLRGMGLNGDDGFVELGVRFPATMTTELRRLAEALPSEGTT